ncbi:MAG: MraY family glycosyltransferase [Micrococcus sp.]|nr:MraY family glycosyltransferase [Micrococcus sp.]
MRAYLLIIIVTFVACLLLTLAVRRTALAGRAYTPQRRRDMHVRPVPKLGGVAMAIAVLMGLIVAATLPFMDGIFSDTTAMRGILMALGVVIAVGIVDDLWDLRWWAKLTGQVGAALCVALAGIRIEALPAGRFQVGHDLAQILLTVFVIVLTMNAINFVDGLDGLATGVALIGGSAFFVYSYLLTRTIDEFDYSNLATLLMALLVGATAGFLPFNRYPARIFMGEVGALLIGLLLATAAVAVTADVGALEGVRFRNVPVYMPVLLPLAVLALPLLDLVTSVIRRTAAGSSPFSADRGHLHHKLVDGGYTQAQAVALLWLWSFIVAWGVVSLNFLDPDVVLPALGAALIIAASFTVHPIVRRRRGQVVRARRWENRRGWWGILAACLYTGTVALLLSMAVAAALGSAPGTTPGGSAALGASVVLVTSALTLALIAWFSQRHPETVLVLSMGTMLIKLVVYGALLGFVPRPDWLAAEPAALSALAVILVWQVTEVLVFARTRRGIYAPAGL